MTRLPHAPRITVEVSAEEIEDSKTRDSSHCMIANAVRASIPDAAYVSVDLQTIRFSDPKKGLRYTYLTPRIGQLALIDFDQGRAPEPFTMRLAGGQVTNAGGKRAPSKRSPAQRAAQVANLKKAHLVQPRKASGTKSTVPDKIGGKAPPTTSFARRRQFGLRELDR